MLDTILSSSFHFVDKWSADGLVSNRARDLLRFLICRLYDQGRGNLISSQLTLAQTSLSKKLGLSRQWVGTLVERLENAGWIEHSSAKLPDGTNGSTVWRIGRTLKRLIVMLMKSKRRKSPEKTPAKSRWHFSPSKKEEKILSILKKEIQPPKPELLGKIPLLKQWMERGRSD